MPAVEDVRTKLPRRPDMIKYRARRSLSTITDAIIHWNGPPVVANAWAQLTADARYHCFTKDWSSNGSGVYGWSLMYHFAINQAGHIYWCNDLEDVLWHDSNGNGRGVGILHILGEGQVASADMLTSSEWLLDELTTRRPDIPNLLRAGVWGHGECGGVYGGGPRYGNATQCPGPQLLAYARAYRAAKPLPAPLPAPPVEPDVYLDEETGVRVSGKILEIYRANGGIGRYGRPLTKVLLVTLPDGDGQPYPAQFFERDLLHLSRDGQTVFEARSGYMLAQRMGFVA